MNLKTIFSVFFLLVFILFMVGCSGNVECGVELNNENMPSPIINPPGETGKKYIGCQYSLEMMIGYTTESIYDGDCVVVFVESENASYNVDMHVVVTDGNISEYRLEVTGGVYGQDAHICESK